MNFLAHSLMGFGDPALIAGQLCGDFVRGVHLSQFPPRVEQGIRLHRYLDRFIDSHVDVQRARIDLPGLPLRFSGIVVDVLFDHFLARHWESYNSEPLLAHAEVVHDALREHHAHLPTGLQRFAIVLAKERILERNVDPVFIAATLARLSRRSPRWRPLAIEQVRLEIMKQQLEDVFVLFYPDLKSAAIAWLDAREPNQQHRHYPRRHCDR